MTPGKLTVGPAGHLIGPANLKYNVPFPTENGRYGSGAMSGVIMHTMVGDLPGTVAEFNNPTAEASAHFGIAQDGTIHQFGPIGKSWIAWAQEAGNATWYSIEHADAGNPNTPLTEAQMVASAQVVECLSAFAGFPLQISNSTATRGFGVHSMGGAAWGGHTCPDLPPSHVRSAQRTEILALAREIRSPVPVATTRTWTATGAVSLTAIAAAQKTNVAAILRETIRNTPGGQMPAALAGYVNAGDLDCPPVPAGVVLYLAGTANHAVDPPFGQGWTTQGLAPLVWLADHFAATLAEILTATIGKYGTFDPVTAAYLDAGDLVHDVVPKGAQLWVPAA